MMNRFHFFLSNSLCASIWWRGRCTTSGAPITRQGLHYLTSAPKQSSHRLANTPKGWSHQLTNTPKRWSHRLTNTPERPCWAVSYSYDELLKTLRKEDKVLGT